MPIHGYKGGVISATPPTTSVSSASGVWTLDEQLQAGANWPLSPTFLSNSVRTRASATAYLTRTASVSPTNNKIMTLSMWVKRGTLGSPQQSLMSSPNSGNADNFRFSTSDTLSMDFQDGAVGQLTTTQVFRDPSSWYHIVLAIDTTQATASNRAKIYVNGSQVTAFGTASYPAQNTVVTFSGANAVYLGRYGNAAQNYFDGYMADVNFIDGQALTPNYFGATDAATGVWEPATYRGTYGTNGFYLPMNVQVEDYSVEYLVVAGGGGFGFAGNDFYGGGGGAGGLLTSTTSVIPSSSYTVTIGAGGGVVTNGSNSVALGFTAIGGGAGGAINGNGASGGSGGGGGGDDVAGTGGAGTGGQGFAGGNGQGGSGYAGGGGGGSSAVGLATVTNSGVGGTGGAGTASSITGSSVTYAAGAGGGRGFYGASPAVGTNGTGWANTANRGHGGEPTPNKTGSSGIVVIRYLGAQRGTGGTVTSAGGYTIHTFTSSGSYTA